MDGGGGPGTPYKNDGGSRGTFSSQNLYIGTAYGAC